VANENHPPAPPPTSAKPVFHSASVDSALLQGNLFQQKFRQNIMIVAFNFP